VHHGIMDRESLRVSVMKQALSLFSTVSLRPLILDTGTRLEPPPLYCTSLLVFGTVLGIIIEMHIYDS
jgi:hypothetical protein